MTFLKFNLWNWRQYINFLIAVLPPFLMLYVSPAEQILTSLILGYSYLILFIIVPLTNQKIDSEKKIDELEAELKIYGERLKKYEPEETTDDELKPDS